MEATVKAVREKALGDLYFFAKVVLQYRHLSATNHLPLCRLLDSPTRRKRVEMPRGTFKSTCASVAKPLLDAVRYPGVKQLLIFNTLDNARKRIREIQDHVEKNSRFRALFPECVPDLSDRKTVWNSECLVFPERGALRGSLIEAAGVDSDITSRHYHRIVEDDPIAAKRDQMTGQEIQPNPEDVQKGVGLHRSLGLLREPDDEERGIFFTRTVVGTRWGVEDLMAWVAENEPDYESFWKPVLAVDGTNNYPECFTDSDLMRMRDVEMGPYIWACLAPGTRILMADWSLKNIEDVQVGDMVMGIQKSSENRARTHLEPTKVLGVASRIHDIQEMTLASGKRLYCTPQHKWWTGRWASRSDPKRKAYAPAISWGTVNHSGGVRALCRVLDIQDLPDDPEVRQAAAYMAGIFDGEGTVTAGGISLCQSHVRHPEVYKAIIENLDKLGFSYGVYERDNSALPNTADCRHIYIQGGRNETFRFLQWCKPARRDAIVKTLTAYRGYPNQLPRRKRDRVVQILPMGQGRVYNIETQTGNYVAEGYASSNSQMQLEPAPLALQSFKPSWLALTWDSLPDPAKVPQYRYVFVDPNYRAGGVGPKSAIVPVCVTPGGIINIFPCVNRRMEINELVRVIIEVVRRHTMRVGETVTPPTVAIEDIGAAKGIRYYLQEKMEPGLPFGVVDVHPLHKESKDSRIRSLTVWAQNGRFRFPTYEEVIEVPEVGSIRCSADPLRQQLLQFGYTADRDLADALSYAPQVISQPQINDAQVAVNPHSAKALLDQILSRTRHRSEGASIPPALRPWRNHESMVIGRRAYAFSHSA